MQRQDAWWAAFGGRYANRPSCEVEVSVPQFKRFARPQAGASKQADERTIGMRPKIRPPRFELVGSSHDEPHLLIGENVGRTAPSGAMRKIVWRHFRARIKSGAETREAANGTQPAGDADGQSRSP
jgi:hypothetical protein